MTTPTPLRQEENASPTYPTEVVKTFDAEITDSFAPFDTVGAGAERS